MSKKSPKVEEVEVEVIGPGRLLAEARIESGLSIDDVANKLNFRVALVKNIEADIFDKSLPDTYNRGYLKNYAKLVNISIPETIEMYEKLNVFHCNGNKMQSFSRGTMKKAENNILMWITYIILAIFIGFTVMWWVQEEKTPTSINSSSLLQEEISEKTEIDNNGNAENLKPLENKLISEGIVENSAIEQELATDERLNNDVLETRVNEVAEVNNNTELKSKVYIIEPEENTLTKTIFTFAGDCWVNIHDALGERVAWGIKKSGYVMTIDAQTPLKITIGKPELVEINFGGENIDMSHFPKGHIAKFNLPFLPQS